VYSFPKKGFILLCQYLSSFNFWQTCINFYPPYMYSFPYKGFILRKLLSTLVTSCQISFSVSVAHLSSHNFNIWPTKHNGMSCMPFPTSSIVTGHGPLLTSLIHCAFPPSWQGLCLLFCLLMISWHVYSHSPLMPRCRLQVRLARPRIIPILNLC
jgi:hypothetical protein